MSCYKVGKLKFQYHEHFTVSLEEFKFDSISIKRDYLTNILFFILLHVTVQCVSRVIPFSARGLVREH